LSNPTHAPAPGTAPVFGGARLLVAGAVAIVIYILLSAAEPYMALPLRECSAKISSALLNALSIPVTRNGTILATDRFTFDVVPACSGSTTLRVLLTLGVIWCSIVPYLSSARRLLCIFLAVPIALAANGGRVAALVALGDLTMRPVEGVVHAMIGIVTFSVAGFVIFLMTEALSSHEQHREVRFPYRAALLGGAMAVMYAPVLFWVVSSWTLAPVESIGLVFIVPAVAALGWLWRTYPSRSDNGWLAAATFGISVAGLAGATFLDYRTLQAWCLLLSVFSVAALLKGRRFGFAVIPLLAVAYLGFPMTTHLIGGFTSRLFGIASLPFVLGLKVLAAICLGVLCVAIWRRLGASLVGDGPGRASLAYHATLFVAMLGVLFQTTFHSRGARIDEQTQLELSYVLGDWVGSDNHVSEVALNTIGRDRIVSRRYARAGKHVDLIVTSTGGDRRRAHAPEWCMAGSGWLPKAQSVTTKKLGDSEVPMSRFLFARGAHELEFYYWFTDGTSVIPTYKQMLNEDLRRRFKGIRTNWLLFRLTAPSRDNDLDAFLTALKPSIVNVQPGR
jgi:EpsI family protein